MRITLENIPEQRIHKLPKWYNWVQLTYETIRVSPNGEEIGWYTGAHWHIKGTEGLWTEIILG